MKVNVHRGERYLVSGISSSSFAINDDGHGPYYTVLSSARSAPLREKLASNDDGEMVSHGGTETQRRDFVYDGWNVVRELITDNGLLTTNYYCWGTDLSGSLQGAGGVGGLFSVIVDGATPATYYPCYDANGNITEYVDELGIVRAEYTFDAFGQTISQGGDMAATFSHRFSTKYADDETGLYYYGFRFYSPKLGRWVNRDPIEEDGGMNLYGFVGNTPCTLTDILGERISNLKIRHSGKANILDEDYIDYLKDDDRYHDIARGDLGMRGSLVTDAKQWVSTGMGFERKLIGMEPAAVAIFKFEYEIERACVDQKEFKAGDYYDGTYKSEKEKEFKLSQVIVNPSGLFYRKKDSGAQWVLYRRHWKYTLPYKDGPTLQLSNPAKYSYGDNVITYAGDVLRLLVPPNKGYEFYFSVDWVVTAKDRNNEWRGKHRVEFMFNDSKPGDVRGYAKILEQPHEVKP